MSAAPEIVAPTRQSRMPVQPSAISTNLIDLSASDTTSSPSEATRTINLEFLQDRTLYHKLSPADVPPINLTHPHKPDPDASLSSLLASGHYRLAADITVRTILQSSPSSTPPRTLLQLFHTRLACLVLLSHPDLALQESLPLLDLLSAAAADADLLRAECPWELRVLLARLQTIGAGPEGGRRGIMALYALASEARAALRAAHGTNSTAADANAARETLDAWTARLRDLGLRVADALVEMGELDTAGRHLAGLIASSSSSSASSSSANTTTIAAATNDALIFRRALLKLRVGDVQGAQLETAKLSSEGSSSSSSSNTAARASLEALLAIADGDYSSAFEAWQALLLLPSAAQEEEGNPPFNEMYAQNAAVALLYMGQMAATRARFEDLVAGKYPAAAGNDHQHQEAPTTTLLSSSPSPIFPALLFNLSTVYELCTERAGEGKNALVQRVAGRTPDPACGGWERASFEFKL